MNIAKRMEKLVEILNDDEKYDRDAKEFNLKQIDDYGTECFNDGLIKGIKQQAKDELDFLVELQKELAVESLNNK